MRFQLSIVILSLLIGGRGNAQDGSAKPLRVGDPAPDFALPFATKDSVGTEMLQLSALFGKQKILLAFYPADWSGGCTKEMCAMRDNFVSLESLGVAVLPISGDYEYSHHEWAKYHNLPFRLLSDHSHTVARMYDSFNQESGFDNRTVFVIDKHGKITYVDPKYSVRDMNSFEKLKEALKGLN
ncbi:MAG TPA: peroxiredoxin [Bacteroidota bacterium]|nr:peroxiredoxin [Bacteroidota bacterium]